VSDERQLTPEQIQAAKMIGHGATYEEVSETLGGNPIAATVGRWNRELDEFKAAVEEAREEDLLAEPEAVAALRRALHATKVNAAGDTVEDHSVQVQAAKALLSRRGVGDAVKPPPKERQTVIYLPPDEDEDEHERPDE